MKKHLIKKEGEKDTDIYSVYKNPDEDLKKEIQNFEIDRTVVEMGWPSSEWKIVEYEEKEVRCENGRNIKYFPKEEVEEALNEKYLYELNQKFPAYKYFTKAFGIISSESKHKKSYKIEKINLKNGMTTGALVGLTRELNPLSVEFYGDIITVDVSDYDGFSIEADIRMNSLNLFFNKEGDYVNRDYNENFDLFKCENISLKKSLEFFEAQILNIKNLQKSGKKYYNDDFCFIILEEEDELKFGVQAVPVRGDGKSYQKWSGYPIYKKPAKLTPSSAEELLNDIRKTYKQEFLDIINENISEIKE